MKNRKLEVFAKIIFFGSIWGILEATLGFALHFVPAFIAGSVMFPIAMFILYRAYKSLGSRHAIMYVALIAMMIKSSNLLLPYLYPAKTINPMVAMFLEASLVFAVIPMLDHKKFSMNVTGIVMASMIWRIAFLAYQGVNYLITGNLAFYLRSFASGFEFVVVYGLLGILLATILMSWAKRIAWVKKVDQIRINPLISFELLILAVVLTLSL